MGPFLAETNPCIRGRWLWSSDLPAWSVALCCLLMILLCVFIVCLTFTTVRGSGSGRLGHTHPGLVLPTSDCPRLATPWGCVVPTGTAVTGRGEGRGGQGWAGFARTLLRHVCVADTWGLLSERTFQNSQIRPPRLWYSIYMHMNKWGPKITIFKLVEQAGGEV